MNFISLFSNPKNIAIGLLHHAPFIKDDLYLRIKYRLEMGENLNLKKPIKFQEKLQWLKLYNRQPEYTKLVDKYAVKEYVKNLIGEKHVIPTLGVWNNFDEIDFNKLPDKFVLKTTHGGGNTGVIICRDKNSFDYVLAKKKLQKSLRSDIYKIYKEWPYKNVPKRIIAEKYIEHPNKKDLTDYKVFCFNGNPEYIQVIQDRNTNETIDFFDVNWIHQKFTGLNFKNRITYYNAPIPPSKPDNLDKMIDFARILAQNTIFLRVDFYNIENHIFFGELTFYPASGFGKFTPDEWDIKIGDRLNIPNLMA